MATPFISTGYSIIQNENSATRKVLVEKTELYKSTLLNGTIGSNSISRIRKNVINKWESSGLLDGLSQMNEYKRTNLALLLESQASQLINDPSVYRRTYNVPVGISSRGFGKIDNKNIFLKIKSFFISLWRKIFKKKDKLIAYDIVADPGFPSILPIATRVAARTVGLDLVSVQPMALPTGLITYLDYKYEEPENVYTRVVIIEKHKPLVYTIPTFRDEDYFIPVRQNVLI